MLGNPGRYGNSFNKVPDWHKANGVLSQAESPQTGQMVGWDSWNGLEVTGALVPWRNPSSHANEEVN